MCSKERQNFCTNSQQNTFNANIFQSTRDRVHSNQLIKMLHISRYLTTKNKLNSSGPRNKNDEKNEPTEAKLMMFNFLC